MHLTQLIAAANASTGSFQKVCEYVQGVTDAHRETMITLADDEIVAKVEGSKLSVHERLRDSKAAHSGWAAVQAQPVHTSSTHIALQTQHAGLGLGHGQHDTPQAVLGSVPAKTRTGRQTRAPTSDLYASVCIPDR